MTDFPTQGGGAGDRETVKALLDEIIEECGNTGFGNPIVNERMIDRIHDAAIMAKDRLSALQAAPSEGGEPVGYVSQYAIDSMADARAEGLYEEFTFSATPWESKTVPVFARPPAPSEEPLVGEETVRNIVSQIVLDLKLRGYASHSGDPDWVKEATAWDRIVARGLAAPAPDAIRGGEGALQAASRPSVPAGGKLETEGQPL